MVPIWCFTAAEMFGGEPAPGIGHHCSNGAGGNTICKLIMCICICICNEAGGIMQAHKVSALASRPLMLGTRSSGH